MGELTSGALIAGYLTVGLFFLRFWKSTRDRLFLLFASAFAVLGLQRLIQSVATVPTEDVTYLYVMRLAAFIIIIIAIIDKNRSSR
jgi:hypothetical protein